MIDANEALSIILERKRSFGIEQCDLEESIGRILAEDVYADRAFPPFNRVSMDGISIKYSSFENGRTKFEIEDIQAAGDQQKTLIDSSYCLEVMTGAICPKGCDTVIQYEHLTKQGDFFIINEAVREGQNVHLKGIDRSEGELLMNSGREITEAEISVLASVGISKPQVYVQPKVAIVSTGNELIEVDQFPEEHQIRKSNIWVLHSALKNIGIEARRFHVQDDRSEIENLLEAAISNFDLIILSGGVSKGKFDFIPEVLSSLGITEVFHRIAQRPGKPLWFGADERCTVFGLPGNPVSTLVCFLKYVRPWLKASQNAREKVQFLVKLASDHSFKPDLHYFLQVKLEHQDDSTVLAVPIEGRGSGDLANLLEVDGFIELPRGKKLYKKGELHPYLSIK